MRIAVWHNLPSGGGRRALVTHVEGLVARGHNVEIWSNPDVAEEAPRFPSGVTDHLVKLASGPFERGGLLPRTATLRRRMAAMSAHLDAVADQINAGRFDVVFAGACRYFRTVDLGGRVEPPAVLYLGEPYRWLYEALPVLPWALDRRRHDESLTGWLRRRVRDALSIQGLRRQVAEEADAAQRWDRILVNSAYSRESVRRAYGVMPRVCYLGVDASRWRHEGVARERMVLGVGALVPEKGIERAIRAIGELSRPRPPLVWVGNVAAPGYEAMLRRLAAELDVEFDVRIAVPDEALRLLYWSATVLLYVPVLEPFGLVPLEASAAGLPVVGIAEAGVRETVVDGVNGLLVMEESELAPALARLLDDSELVASLSRAAVELATTRWSADAALDRLEHHLFDVVRGLPS